VEMGRSYLTLIRWNVLISPMILIENMRLFTMFAMVLIIGYIFRKNDLKKEKNEKGVAE